jgi:hypothetical protein
MHSRRLPCYRRFLFDKAPWNSAPGQNSGFPVFFPDGSQESAYSR